MSDGLLSSFKIALLVVIYLFFFRVLRTVWAQLKEPRVIVHEADLSGDEAIILDLEHAPRVGIRRSLKPAMLPPEALEFLAPRHRTCYYFEKLVDPQMPEAKS